PPFPLRWPPRPVRRGRCAGWRCRRHRSPDQPAAPRTPHRRAPRARPGRRARRRTPRPAPCYARPPPAAARSSPGRSRLRPAWRSAPGRSDPTALSRSSSFPRLDRRASIPLLPTARGRHYDPDRDTAWYCLPLAPPVGDNRKMSDSPASGTSGSTEGHSAVAAGSPPPTRRATLHEVAAVAGVSLKTASRALGGEAYVSEQTRKQVLDAARQLGYQRNAAASLLARGLLTDSIGLITGDFTNPFYSALAE